MSDERSGPNLYLLRYRRADGKQGAVLLAKAATVFDAQRMGEQQVWEGWQLVWVAPLETDKLNAGEVIPLTEIP